MQSVVFVESHEGNSPLLGGKEVELPDMSLMCELITQEGGGGGGGKLRPVRGVLIGYQMATVHCYGWKPKRMKDPSPTHMCHPQ